MKRLFIIISIVVLSITFNFCDNKNQESSEAYQTAMRYYDEAYNLSSNDSISEAFTKFIEIARLFQSQSERDGQIQLRENCPFFPFPLYPQADGGYDCADS